MFRISGKSGGNRTNWKIDRFNPDNGFWTVETGLLNAHERVGALTICQAVAQSHQCRRRSASWASHSTAMSEVAVKQGL